MTTELPPCPLPDCQGGEHHFHDICGFPIGTGHDCARAARDGFRCYSPHQPQSPQWQPIERERIECRECAGSGWRHRSCNPDEWCKTCDGVGIIDCTCPECCYQHHGQHHPDTTADPDADLIELIGKAIYDADGSTCEWGEDGTEDVYRKLARAALNAVRESGDMSYYDYRISASPTLQDVPFYALIMAAARRADTDNLAKLRMAWPEVVAELEARYNAPGGLLPGEAVMGDE